MANDAFLAGFEKSQQKQQQNAPAKANIKAATKPASGLSTESPSIGALIDLQPVKSYKHGGRVKHTGFAYLHKGERVVPAKRHVKTLRKTRIKA